MKKLGMILCVVGLLCLCSGCVETGGLTDEQEIAIGREAAEKLEYRRGVWFNPQQTARLERIGKSLKRKSSRENLPWSFTILRDNKVNAYALPGGFIYVTRGVIDMNLSDDELAGLLATEIAHVTERHAAKSLANKEGVVITNEATQESYIDLEYASELVLELVVMEGYGSDVYEADKEGTRLAYKSNYEIDGLLNFIKKVGELGNRQPEKTSAWERTHPSTSRRVTKLEEFIDEFLAKKEAKEEKKEEKKKKKDQATDDKDDGRHLPTPFDK